MANIEQYKDAVSVTQDNELVEAGYTLTLNEKRLLLLGMSKIDPTQFPRKAEPASFELSAEEWGARFPDDNPWRAMRRAAKRMLTRTVTLNPKTGITEDISWFDSVKYYETEGRLRVRFSWSIHIRLAGMLEQFTRVNLLSVSKFNRFHTIRLYELLSQFRSTGYRVISLDDFRLAMDCLKSYPTTKEFKRAVLNPSLKELNQKSDLQITCSDLKRGRKVAGFEFIFSEKKQGDLFDGSRK